MPTSLRQHCFKYLPTKSAKQQTEYLATSRLRNRRSSPCSTGCMQCGSHRHPGSSGVLLNMKMSIRKRAWHTRIRYTLFIYDHWGEYMLSKNPEVGVPAYTPNTVLPGSDCRKKPSWTWLRMVADDVKLMNFGIHTAWRKEVDRKEWRRVVGTAWSLVPSSSHVHVNVLGHKLTQFWSVESCHFSFFPGESHSLQILLDYISAVCSWPTNSPLEVWNPKVYSACCGMHRWSIDNTWPSQRSLLSLRVLAMLCCLVLALISSFVMLSCQEKNVKKGIRGGPNSTGPLISIACNSRYTDQI